MKGNLKVEKVWIERRIRLCAIRLAEPEHCLKCYTNVVTVVANKI